MEILSASQVGVVPVYEMVQVVIGALILGGGLLILGVAVNHGRVKFVQNAADALERRTGYPRWAILPLVVMFIFLIIGAFGMIWDVSWHLEKGRDNGLVSQPSHVLAIIGLYGAFVGSALSLVLVKDKPSVTAIKIRNYGYVPLGGLIAFLSFFMTLATFPLDDVWHRIYGLDVSLWSPIHFVLLASAISAFFGMGLLLFEGEAAVSGRPALRAVGIVKVFRILFVGVLVAIMGILLDEWNVALPQANMLYEPMLLATTVAAFIAARLLIGRWGALAAWGVATGLNVLLVGAVALLFGGVAPRMPLLLGFAVAVEFTALILGTKKIWRLAVFSGVLASALGLSIEYIWSNFYRPLPWQLHMMPEAWIIGLAIGISASIAGVYAASSLLHREEISSNRHVSVVVSAFALVGAIGLSLSGPTLLEGKADIRISEVVAGENRSVNLSVKFYPENITENADWFYVASWQGDGIKSQRLVRGDDGFWRTTQPLLVSGKWKVSLRIAKNGARSAIPIRFPEDKELGLAEISAESGQREFVSDVLLMQRERKVGTPLWLVNVGVLGCVMIWIGLVGLIIFGFTRMARSGAGANKNQDLTELAQQQKKILSSTTR
ncbi:MAG: hypothetical protein ACRCSF_08375 [Mycobacteriaceae bacterium]